mmetsp:Transcript_10322/g.17782  ORF Transcript_10322/g.17782 Transcript_10322/m.17782 type:complete len:271 (-) Transcript_10322:283-1095(-)
MISWQLAKNRPSLRTLPSCAAQAPVVSHAILCPALLRSRALAHPRSVLTLRTIHSSPQLTPADLSHMPALRMPAYLAGTPTTLTLGRNPAFRMPLANSWTALLSTTMKWLRLELCPQLHLMSHLQLLALMTLLQCRKNHVNSTKSCSSNSSSAPALLVFAPLTLCRRWRTVLCKCSLRRSVPDQGLKTKTIRHPLESLASSASNLISIQLLQRLPILTSTLAHKLAFPVTCTTPTATLCSAIPNRTQSLHPSHLLLLPTPLHHLLRLLLP